MSVYVGICHSGKTRCDNSSFHIIGYDDLHAWWKEAIGLDIVEQPSVISCTSDLSAGLDIMHVVPSSTLPVVLSGMCWVLLRVVRYCSTPRERKSGRMALRIFSVGA
jgi:hypothetical protein